MTVLDQITLRSKDGKEFNIKPSVAFESEILKNQIQGRVDVGLVS